MRRTRISFASLCLALFGLLLMPLLLKAEEVGEYIAIRKAGASRIAVVLDKTVAKGDRESAWASSLDATIKGGLDFTGLFNLMPAPLNIRNAQGGTLNLASIASVGGDIYAGGGVTKRSGKPVLEMYVYDASGKPLLHRNYSGEESQLRAIGLRFCADLVELLTGKRSVFGTRIVFVANRTGHKEVYMCDFDGENVVQLSNSGSISLTPAVSPDGNYLAWTDYTSGKPDLYIKNLATGAKVSVNKHGVSISPAWRPGTNTLATTLSYQGDQDLYLIRADGSIDRRLTNSKGIDVSPSFSPDGSKMAFVSTRQGGPQIFVQDLGSGQVRRLTYSGTYNTQPSWSPNGDKILYSSMQKSGEINIFSIGADGSGLLQLTSGSRNNEYPSWSPDGSMIVFSSTREGRRKLYVMNADGTNQKPLLRMQGEQQQPSWSVNK